MQAIESHAVERVIEEMKADLSRQISLDQMARMAMFSKFHFTRVFTRVTGISPARYLSALRLQVAKDLLISTDLSVTDICHQVGYNSPGTFSSRFKRSVGVSPSVYRQVDGFLPLGRPPSTTVPVGVFRRTIEGVIEPAMDPELGRTYVGLFCDSIPQGRPVSCCVLEAPGRYFLDQVPEGTWYLFVHTTKEIEVAVDQESATRMGSRREVVGSMVGSSGPIAVTRSGYVGSLSIELRSIRPVDPPILFGPIDARSVRRHRGFDTTPVPMSQLPRPRENGSVDHLLRLDPPVARVE